MPNPSPANGFRLTTDGTAFVVDYGWKRDTTWTIQFSDPVTDANKALAPGTTLEYQLYDKSNGTSLKAGTLSITDAPSGVAELAIAEADLPTLTWDLGETLKVLLLYIQAVLSGSDEDVFDDTGVRAFPFRVTWEPAP